MIPVWIGLAYGAPELLLERLARHSDIHNIFVCKDCGLFAIGNREEDFYVCSFCQKPDSCRVVQSVWAFKVFSFSVFCFCFHQSFVFFFPSYIHKKHMFLFSGYLPGINEYEYSRQVEIERH